MKVQHSYESGVQIAKLQWCGICEAWQTHTHTCLVPSPKYRRWYSNKPGANVGTCGGTGEVTLPEGKVSKSPFLLSLISAVHLDTSISSLKKVQKIFRANGYFWCVGRYFITSNLPFTLRGGVTPKTFRCVRHCNDLSFQYDILTFQITQIVIGGLCIISSFVILAVSRVPYSGTGFWGGIWVSSLYF